MSRIELTWSADGAVDEFLIYRSEQEFTELELPELLATSESRSYSDHSVIKGNTYHYMIASRRDDQSLFSDLVTVQAIDNSWSPSNLTSLPNYRLSAENEVVESGGAVSSWGDFNNANTASQSNSSLRPRVDTASYILPIVIGSDSKYLTFPAMRSWANNKSKNWFFIVGKMASSGTAYFFNNMQNDLDSNKICLTQSGGNVALAAKRVSYDTWVQVADSAGAGEFFMAYGEVLWSQGSKNISVNGKAKKTTSFASSSNSVAANSKESYLFTWGQGQTGTNELGICEFLAGDQTNSPTPEEIDKLFGWAAHKYGLQAKLPESHIYKPEKPYL